MDWSDPEVWRWIWLVTAVVFAVGEIAVAGTFFLGPFSLGAAAAAVLAFLGVDVGPQWVAFVGVSIVALLALRPLARRLDAEERVVGVGAGRQVGQRARVVEAIDSEHDHGFVMLGAARWRAESADGSSIPLGATVTVTDIRGTRVVVERAAPTTGDAAAPSSPLD